MTKNLPATVLRPRISVVILNYNGQIWMPRCLDSLGQQTILNHLEIILTDNHSLDGSDQFTREWLARTGAQGQVVQNGSNLFYCAANNHGAAVATGEFLLFLNNDTWLEPDCLEKLYDETVRAGAAGASPLLLNYDDDKYQGGGASGLDFFGMVVGGAPATEVTETFVSPGCCLFVQTEMFRTIGGFPPEILIYADETDLSWRIWIAGGKIVSVPTARLHHRGAAVVNAKGETKTVETRSTDSKRFLANRNGILLLLKNSQHVLLLLVLPHLLMLLAEAFLALLMVRRWSFIRKAYLAAIVDAFKMHAHVREWRRRIRKFRQRGDFWMLRFLRLKPSRWDEVQRLLKFGPPKIDAK